MKRVFLSLFFSCLVALPAAAQDNGVALEAFKTCAVADVVTTGVGIGANLMHEINPITKALYIKALGPVLGTAVPLVALSVLIYRALEQFAEPVVTEAAAGVTCFAAARNLWIIR